MGGDSVFCLSLFENSNYAYHAKVSIVGNDCVAFKSLAEIFLNITLDIMPVVLKSEDINVDYIVKEASSKLFDDYNPIVVPSKRFEAIKISKDKSTIKLIDRNQLDLLSVVNGSKAIYHNKEYYEIKGTYSKNKGRGYLTYLFEIIVYELGYCILSDREHSSPGSKEFWQAQMRRKKFDIYRINIKTNHKRKASNFKESEIWREFRRDVYNEFSEHLEDLDGHNLFNEIDDSSLLDFDEIDEETINNLENQFGNTTKSPKTDIRDIRLIAQKYFS